MFSCYSERGLFWFRIFGRGLVVKDVRLHPLLFSERHGYQRMIRIGPWVIRYLRKEEAMSPEVIFAAVFGILAILFI